MYFVYGKFDDYNLVYRILHQLFVNAHSKILDTFRIDRISFLKYSKSRPIRRKMLYVLLALSWGIW